jgi:hypothetical protein
MNWQDIINNSELVYASATEDKGFRTWSLKKTTCNVSFYESYPIDETDTIICSILEKSEGTLSEEELATVLGFNVVDNFDVSPKRYADKAELEIFRAIIKPVLDWGLVEKIPEKPALLQLTDLGYRALQTGEKYKFYSGQKKLLENPNIKPLESQKNMFFPFYSALSEYTEITGSRQIAYSEIKSEEIFDIQETDLIRRHKLQSNQEIQIYKAEPTIYFEFGSCQVDIRLYKQGNDYYPIIFYNNRICVEATELLNMTDNIKEQEKKVEWGLYLKLIRDPNAVLDYETIIPFEDLLELDSLIKDTRLAWNDKQLFSFIAEQANANQWFSISNHCPIDVLKLYLQTYADKLDWTSLSLKIDDDFLIQNATKYPWNFEAISAKEDTHIEIIKTLLLIPELKEQEWAWDRIMPELDFEFIKSNIDKVDFELSELTKTNIDEVKPLIIQYPEKRWNWPFISTDFDLTYILDNILNFSKFLNLKNVINRAFVSENEVNLFCKSADFVKIFSETKESALKDYQPSQANYFWTELLIDLLETTGYLQWGSGIYTLGFECNQFIDWNFDFFNKYHLKIATQKGFDFVSKYISDTRIVNQFPDFDWNWDIISANTNLINDKKFVLSFTNKLNFAFLLQYIDSEILEELFEQQILLTFLENNPDGWQLVTKKSSIEYVRKHIDYNWDWSILTKRFCSSIKIEALGNPKWINKWNWLYLTQNLDLSTIYDNLDLYVDYWDWKYLTEKLDKDFILNNLSDYNENWYWDILLNVRLDKSDLLFSTHLTEIATCISELEDELHSVLWRIITHKFDYGELDNLIAQSIQSEYADLFQWDYAYFYDLPAFNVRQYLNESAKIIKWQALSGSKALNKTFRWDKSLFNYDVWLKDVLKLLKITEYQWNFRELSKLDSINWNDAILNINTEQWDWNYLSEYSSCLKKGKEFVNRFRKFSKHINFQIFSKRTDSDITEKLLSDNLDKDWDWAALSANKSIDISLVFIKGQKDKPWDWQILSERTNIIYDNETLIELSNQNWDWSAISKRKDIIFSEELITKLYEKPFDWLTVSQNKTFIPNTKILSLLKGQTLDWIAISKNSKLTTEILWDYRDSLMWEYLTKNGKLINIADEKQLDKYQNYLDWNYISQSEKFNISLDILKQFKDKLNWKTINERIGDNVSEELLESFADVLNWSIIAQSMKIHFTEDLIEKYRSKWDWQLLRKNPQVIERLETTLNKYKGEFNCVDFIERFQYTPYIYHFTHLFNAIDIIKSRKILSRNKAEGKFANAAGNLVARRGTAHDYARFYYRPQTPTQFYNECLGMDSKSGYWKTWYYYGEHRKWKTYYPQARNLGLPKCPIPVFFKIDLKEVIMKMSDKCFYSTGNMQTNWARVEKVSENPNSINTEHLYSDVSDYENYKQYSQQEFLVEEEFDFSTLDSFEIVCYNEEYATLLKAQLGNDPICEKIKSNGSGIFHRGNRELNIDETETEISISSEYCDNAYLSITGEGLKNIQILNPNRIQKETATEIIAYPEIRFTKTEQPIEVRFVDLAIGKREWLIYKN